MKKKELAELIWDTRRDVLHYIHGHTWTYRSTEELLIPRQYDENIDNLGFKTTREYELAVENERLKKDVELLKETIKLLSNK